MPTIKAKKRSRFVVVVQRSLSTTHDTAREMTYNQDRTVFFEGPLTDAVDDVLGHRDKAFFWARMKGTKIELMERAPWQDW